MEKMSFAAFKSAALEKLVVLKSLLTLGWGMAVKKATEARPEDVEKARAAAEATKEKATKIKSKLDGKVPPIVWKVAGIVIVVLCAWFLLDALLLFAVLFVAYVLIGLFLQGKNRPLPASADKIVLPSILAVSLIVGVFFMGGGGYSGGIPEIGKDSFYNMFYSNAKSENGVAYIHKESSNIKVLSVVPDGIIACYESGSGGIIGNAMEAYAENLMAIAGEGSPERVVHIVTDPSAYNDGMVVKGGLYLRDGTYSYESLTGSRKVESYRHITDESVLKAIEERQMASRRVAEAALIASEGDDAKVSAPVKSLCGFELGTVPYKGWKLLKGHDNAIYSENRTGGFHRTISGELAKPFRMFTDVKLEYTDYEGVPEHLYIISLSAHIDFSKVDKDSCVKELSSVCDMIEKKFGIKMSRTNGGRMLFDADWHIQGSDGFDDENLRVFLQNNGILNMTLWCQALDKQDLAAKEANKKKIEFSGNEGSDRL